MPNNKDDLFAPPSKEELALFAPPSAEEIAAAKAPQSLTSTIGSNIASKVAPVIDNSTSKLADISKYLGGKAVDTSMGVANGATMGLGSSIGGAISTGIDAFGDKILPALNPTADLDEKLKSQGFNIEKPDYSDPSVLLAAYRKNQQDTQGQFNEAKDRSPVVNTLGQMGGGAVTGGAILGTLSGPAAVAAGG